MEVDITQKRPILLIDGMNLFIRSFVVNEAMNVSGDLVGGTLGFLRSLKWIVNTLKPAKVFVVWEQGGGCPRRKKIYPEYKANRAKQKDFNNLYKENGKLNPMADQENKAQQLGLLTKALGFLPVCQVYVPDVECDDVIAYLVKNKFKTYQGLKIVVSTDKDFYQLLEDKSARVYDPATRTLITHEHVSARFGISARNLVLARSVVGDPSDNIDGIEGVGLKTIAKRFTALADDSVDLDVGWLMEKANGLQKEYKKPIKAIENIIQGEGVIRRNWELMYLSNVTLAANQISKINFRIDDYKPLINKLEYLKTFTAADIPVTKDMENIPNELQFLMFNS